MNWFLYDRDLFHERVKPLFLSMLEVSIILSMLEVQLYCHSIKSFTEFADFIVWPYRTKHQIKSKVVELSTNERVWYNFFVLIAKSRGHSTLDSALSFLLTRLHVFAICSLRCLSIEISRGEYLTFLINSHLQIIEPVL